MSIITVNKEKCTQCNACVESCPISLFKNQEGKAYPEIPEANEKRCIYCGHCEAVCPTGALTLIPSIETGKESIDIVSNLNPTELGAYFKSRRSIRKFKSRPVERKTIEQVMEIVRYAPTGTNRQMNQWTVVSNPEIIKQLADSTVEWMKQVVQSNPEMAARLGMRMIIAAHTRGFDVICHNAPQLIIAHTPASYGIGSKDAVIGTSHLELLLPSFGLGGCWAGYLMLALQQYPEAKKLIGLDDTSTVHAALMVGFPKYKYKRIPARKEANVNWL